VKVYCGIDWAESQHDVAVVDEFGQQLTKRRISDDLAGFTALAELLVGVTSADVADVGVDAGFVAVDIAIETDRGLLVAALRAAGHRVWGINPKAVDRYRDRHSGSGAKSDPGDALVLANILRTDAHAHRLLPADSDLVTGIGVLARIHQDLVRRRRAEGNAIRNLLREYFPAALIAFPDLSTATAVLVLSAAPTPAAAAALTHEQLVDLLRQAGRGTLPKQATRLVEIFRTAQLRQPTVVEEAMGQALTAMLVSFAAAGHAVRDLEAALAARLPAHRDVAILASLPAMGTVLLGRLLAEFGDDPDRFADAAARRAYAGTSPVTRASGKKRVVLRRSGNRRLIDTCRTWAFSALTASPGDRAHYDRRRAAHDGHEAALRNLANKLIGQLDYCLRNQVPYREDLAWPPDDCMDASAAA
jgi:transposase